MRWLATVAADEAKGRAAAGRQRRQQATTSAAKAISRWCESGRYKAAAGPGGVFPLVLLLLGLALATKEAPLFLLLVQVVVVVVVTSCLRAGTACTSIHPAERGQEPIAATAEATSGWRGR